MNFSDELNMLEERLNNLCTLYSVHDERFKRGLCVLESELVNFQLEFMKTFK